MRIMDPNRLQRPRYVHKRAISGGNETATVEAVQGSTTVSSDARSSSITPTTQLSSTSLSTTISQATLLQVSSSSSTALVSPTSVTASSSSLPVLEKTSSSASLPTSINSSASPDATGTLVPLSMVIPSEISSDIQSISSARQLLGAPANAPSPSASSVPLSTEASNSPVAPVPAPTATSTSVSLSTSISTSTSASVSPAVPEPTSTPNPVPTSVSSSISVSPSSQLPSSIEPNLSAATSIPSSLLLDSSMVTASLTSMILPSFTSSTSLSAVPTTSIVPTNNALQAPSSAFAASSSAATPIVASTNTPQAGASLNNSMSGGQNNTMTIVGAAVGSVAGFVFLALLGIFCVRRRYRNTTVILSPFSRRQSGRDRVPLSPGSISEGFRPDPKMLFSKESLSTFDEKDTASSSRANSPPFRHSRSYTTTSLPPVVPARSVARPISIAQQPPVLPKPITNPGAESIDTSFMGTISTYFSSIPNVTEEPFPFDSSSRKPSSTDSSSVYTSNTTSSATLSPHASFMPPITPNLPATATIPPPSTIPPRAPINPPLTQSPSPPPPSSLRASSAALAPSRYQSMGAWRDSMWSTSATPIAPAHLPPGTSTSNYNPFSSRPGSTQQHRASRSLGDVLDWRTDPSPLTTNPLPQVGIASSLYSPNSSSFPPSSLIPAPLVVVPAPDMPLAVPPRSPLRAWPLRGN